MKKLIMFITVLSLFGCTDAEMAKVSGLGAEYKIELINCDGSVARTWISSGKVSSEANSDGYFFNEKSTGKLIEVTGTLIITKQ
jgi:hypothetical protein